MAESRKTYGITFNKGLDKASLPFEASPARALDEMNYVYRDGKVQKRFGIEQLFQAEGTKYQPYSFTGVASGEYKANGTNFNGLWHFTAEDGNGHLIAHIGKLLYELSEQSEGTYVATPFVCNAPSTVGGVLYYSCYEFEDYKSVAVIGNKALYFLGGNKLMKLRYAAGGSYSLLPVEDNADTYIPLTTVSITCLNATANGRASLDQVNLLTQWRTNRLLTGVAIDASLAANTSDFGYVYQLDAPIIGKSAGDVSSIRVRINRRNS